MEREKRIDKMRELNLIIDDYKVKDEKYSDTQIIYNQMKTQYEKMQVDYKAIEQEVNALRVYILILFFINNRLMKKRIKYLKLNVQNFK